MFVREPYPSALCVYIVINFITTTSQPLLGDPTAVAATKSCEANVYETLEKSKKRPPLPLRPPGQPAARSLAKSLTGDWGVE